ncbi:MAG: O-antigen ligase family protein [Candidatus Omnitrophota bacterium]
MVYQKINKTLIHSLLLGFVCAFFLLKFIPLASTNPLFVLGLFLFFTFVFIMILWPKFILFMILFSRGFLDPLFSVTKIDIFGQEIGVGGVLNFLIIMLALFLLVTKYKTVFRHKFVRYWVLFLALCFAAIFYSPVKVMGVRFFLNLLTYLSIFVIPFIIVDKEADYKYWFGVLFFSSFIPVTIGIIDVLHGGTVSLTGGMRIRGSFSHPNILAFYIVLMIAVVFCLLKDKKFKHSFLRSNLLRFYGLILFVLLIYTKTRSAWISCWVLFFLYGVFKERRYILYALIVPPFLLLNQSVYERVSDLFMGRGYIETGVDSLRWRLELWKSTLLWIRRRFLFGYGLSSFEELSNQFFFTGSGSGAFAHNAYLKLLFETGVFGLFSFVMVYLSILHNIFLKIKNSIPENTLVYAAAISYLFSYLVASGADNMLYYLAFNWYFWFFIGLILKGGELPDEGFSNNTII